MINQMSRSLVGQPYLDTYDVRYCRAILGPLLFNSFTSYLEKVEECAFIKCVDDTNREASQYTQGQGCHSEGLRQTGGKGQREPCESQQ